MTRQLSVLLDIIRLAAALLVLVGHSTMVGLYADPPFFGAMQHNAVIVFFVLSGLVIATSVDTAKPSLSDYAVARLSRILPVALPIVVFSAAVAAIDAALPVPMFSQDIGGLRLGETLLAGLFLSESYRVEFGANPPYWSLCYEVWYYALFAAATFLRGRRRIACLAVGAILAGPNALLMLPVWLTGVALARLPQARAVPPLVGTLLVALALFSFAAVQLIADPLHAALRSLFPWALGYSLYAFSDCVLALAVALGFAGLRAMTLEGLPLLERFAGPIRTLGNMSFALYLLHWPLMKLLRILGVTPSATFLGVTARLALVLAICMAFAAMTDRCRPAFRTFLQRAIGRCVIALRPQGITA